MSNPPRNAVIPLPPGVPGIRSLLQAYPETGGALMQVAQAVLRGPSPLSEGERELLAAAVSHENRCEYCMNSHAATARVLLGEHAEWVDFALSQRLAELPPPLAALVQIARAVTRSGHGVDEALFQRARDAGAGDRELHDAVLVASAFSLYNRYVDALGTPLPEHPDAYKAIGARLASDGYLTAPRKP